MYSILFFVLTLFIGLALNFMGIHIVTNIVITVIAVFSLYITIAIIRQRKRINLLDELCDPEKFQDSTMKQEEITGNSNNSYLFTIDNAVSYMELGDYKTGLNLLESIEKGQLSKNKIIQTVYYIDLMICYYELGFIDKAENLFETVLPLTALYNKRLKQSIDILIGERFYYLGRYEESYEHLSKIIKEHQLSKRSYLEIIHRLAKMDELKGDKEKAIKRYEKVIKFGNKLGIVNEAKDRLNNLKD
jgi:tetratricopeptide (TPR) repeat protein